ncbi:glycosyltransferase [Lachnoclostridium sp. Marseille-P6806]|uniref:glycosyltransferase n=1 Tax=Lachnoclostridium sp. Marseille-P6806 TaxID=2364793 RepID=UPI00102FF600|nr:glycosyltransferase [Lachnoclostridium sp. Marseille-P6806]
MRLVIINSVYGYGSTGRICAALAEEYRKKGYEVRAAYGRSMSGMVQPEAETVRIGTDADVRLHGVLTRLTDRHGLGSARATRKFLHWLDDFAPDELWLHNLHGYYIHYELLFAWIKKHPGLRVTWTLHDCWAFTGHCSHFMAADGGRECAKWKTGCSCCPARKEYPASLMLDQSLSNYMRKKAAFSAVGGLHLIVPSKWLRDQVKQSFLGGYPVEVCYNTINKDVFRPRGSDFRKHYHLEDRIMILGVASVWSDKKGLDDFVRLSRFLGNEAGRFCIVLVGIPKELAKVLPPDILCIGRTESAETLAQIYSAADIFVNPTREDNYPTVNLESEACGTPVITYDTGGCRETLHLPESSAIRPEFGALVEELEHRYGVLTLSCSKTEQ